MHQTDIEAREKFLFTLEWILSVSNRYQDTTLRFGLAHVSVGNSQNLGEAYGAQGASRKLVEVSQALRNAFRKTDLVARDGVDYWILAPYTPPENISEKIMDIVREASKNGLDVTDRNVAVFSLPLKVPLYEASGSAQGFLQAIKSLCESRSCDVLCEPNVCLKVSLQAGSSD